VLGLFFKLPMLALDSLEFLPAVERSL